MRPRLHFVLSIILLLVHPVSTRSQWVQTIPDTAVVSFATDGTNLFAGAYEEPIRVTGFSVFCTTNSGNHWTNVGAGVGGTNVNALVMSGTNLLAATDGGYVGQGVYLSTNNGASWTATVLNGPVFAFAVKGGNLFAGTTGGGVQLSTNNGTTWSAINIGLTPASVSAFATTGTNLFAGTDGGGTYLSTNNGANWIAINAGLTNARIKALAVSETNLYAGTYGGVFLSTNGGGSWSAVNDGLNNTYVLALAVSGTNLFAGTWGGGIFLSTNSGGGWIPVNNGLTSTSVFALAVSGPHLFAGTWAGGVWRRPLSELVSVESERTTLPESFTLGQNYPNPFNPSTTIEFEIASRSKVTLKVFDVLGREVTSLVNDILEPGYESIRWDARNVTSGVYFYQLRAGAFIETRKMSLVK